MVAIISIAVLAFVPTNIAKLLALLAVWGFFLLPLSRREWLLFTTMNLLFVGLDISAIQQGVFTFTKPDLMGLPMWELVMWGFYGVFTVRFVQGTGGMATQIHRWAWPSALVFTTCFMVLKETPC